MSGDLQRSAVGVPHDIPAPVSRNALLILDPPEVDEFDIDVRFGEVTGGRVLPGPFLPLDAQTDGAGCLPTGGKGAGGTCNTADNTCQGTCAGLNTCPQTQCGNTCAVTCGNTCAATCRDTCVNTCADTCEDTCGVCATFAQTHCFTCRSGCREPL
ncbi:hypothetical protein SAMN05421678_12926 [Actinopolymorpha cephalotaxi]|uniref:Uncharacterized protein n=1 Tax=Actinopolymorpha cephalotaxi TaxID=504797 RepID=A0A1I3C5K4_9ACTN|nr:hypothetical protein [Actinopolymorpha cephalotaxi]SFH69606.1 hypothetical protein SAMN05421678_12926 [Actinopolymorpha cephalotaxi]